MAGFLFAGDGRRQVGRTTELELREPRRAIVDRETLVNDRRWRRIARSDALKDESSCAPGRNPLRALEALVGWNGGPEGRRPGVRFENQTLGINGIDCASLFHDALHRRHYAEHSDAIAAARHDPDQKASRRKSSSVHVGSIAPRLSRQHLRRRKVSLAAVRGRRSHQR